MPKPRIIIKLDGEDRMLADVCAMGLYRRRGVRV